MRTFELPSGATPREAGRAHGEMFRGEIASLAQLRVHLTCVVGRMSTEAEVLELAARHVPVLEEFDRDLTAELFGIAEGANLTPAHIVVLNHYTDLRDIGATAAPPGGSGVSPTDDGGRAGLAREGPPDDGCTIVYAKSAGVLAQTWDMHATAIPYVMMLRTAGAWLLSLTGCLGMAGFNRNGVAIAINNLHSTDARVGVVWPALVRRALREPSAAAARDAILASPVGSGHHYLVADADSAFGIETSGQLRKVIYAGETDHYVHTNHCLDGDVAKRSRVPAGSTTGDRFDAMSRSVANQPVADVFDAWQRLGSHDGYPRSVCTNMATPQNPHGAATCGGIAVDLRGAFALAAPGFTHNVHPERFDR